jgi:hypothetical protein
MKHGIITAICLMVLCVLPAKATLVIIQISAEVDDVADPYGYLGGKIKVGDIISGRYVYDSLAPDLNTWGTQGAYEYRTSPHGVFLSVNGFQFQTDPKSVNFVIDIGNDYSRGDSFFLLSYNNLALPTGIIVSTIAWELDDYTGTALSSDSLPTTAPILDDWQLNKLSMAGIPRYQPFAVYARVTSAEVIPEPSTMLILGLGALVLRKRR